MKWLTWVDSKEPLRTVLFDFDFGGTIALLS
jgi:hypothetical protein